MFFFIEKIKKLIQGTILDTYLRIFICYISRIYYKNVNKIKTIEFDKCLIILYGGMGDSILLFPLINNLSKKYNLEIMIEDKFFEITSLLDNKINFIKYKKNQIFKTLINYKKKNKKFILLQQSPIFEFLIFNFLLGRPAVIGFIYNQKILNIEGLNKKNSLDTALNKIKKYHLFFHFISKHVKLISFKCKKNITSGNKLSKIYKNYFVLAPSKTSTWNGVGILENSVYIDIIDYICRNSKLTPILVGSKDDLPMVNNLLKNLPQRLKFKNLVGKTNLQQLIQIIKKANFVISNDNGIHHLSNYLNKKTLTFFTFSSCEALKWDNRNSHFIFNKKYNCMPCVGNKTGPFDNYPFQCPWKIRCKNSITSNLAIKKIEKIKLI